MEPMKHRAALWQRLAVEHPWSFWLTESTAIYGLFALMADLQATLGWGEQREWPARLFAALGAGAGLLWVTRRRSNRPDVAGT